MTFTEIITTYLAVGAPFGVYYFLKYRGKSVDLPLLTKSIATALLWVLFVVGLLNKRFARSEIILLFRRNWNFLLDNKVENAARNILDTFAAVSVEMSGETTSFFEFRETLERYIGLTLAAQHSSANSGAAKHEIEVFRVINYESRALRLAEKIIHRKNCLRLKSHESMARHDFLHICRSLKESFLIQSSSKSEIWQQYQTAVTRLFELLEDAEAIEVFLSWGEMSLVQAPQLNNKPEPDLKPSVQPLPLANNFPATVSSQRLVIRAQD